MKSIGIIYGSNGGATENIAKKAAGILDASLYNVSELSIEDIGSLDFIIFATSTWGSGDLCDDWEINKWEVLYSILYGQRKNI